MKLEIYPILSTNSKRAISKVTKKWGHPYSYSPRRILIARLCSELGWTEQQVRQQIKKEREFLIKNKRYFNI